MNITTYPYHLTERQLKLCHVRDPSTVTGPGLDSPNTWRTRSRPLFAICDGRRNPILYLGLRPSNNNHHHHHHHQRIFIQDNPSVHQYCFQRGPVKNNNNEK